MTTLSECQIIEFQRIPHRNGTIAVAQNSFRLPFAIERVFYIYDIPSDTIRGGHAHRRGHEIIVAASGSFDVTISDGIENKTITLNRPYKGLYVPPGIWVEIKGFSSGCVLLALCSNNYIDEDYIRSHSDYLTYIATPND